MSGQILVVDDDLSYAAFVTHLLAGAGFTVQAVSTGAEAIEAIRANAPALVLLDVRMPGVSGYEVCRVIREDLGLDVPVMFVSGERTEPVDRVAGLTIGADDYLVKPFAPDELLARVRCLLRRNGRARAQTTQLTSRELEVLTLLADGLDQAGIARGLVISPKTVGTHIEHILIKLGVHSRAEAVAYAYRLQLVSVPA